MFYIQLNEFDFLYNIIYLIFSRRVLKLYNERTDNGTEKYTMDNLGGVVWELFGCNFAAWVLVFLCLFKGLGSKSFNHFYLPVSISFRINIIFILNNFFE